MSLNAHTGDWWAGKWAWVWPIVAASFLVLVTIVVYARVNPGSLIFEDFVNPQAKVASAKLNGLLWGSAAIIFLVVSIAATMALATTVITSTRGYPRRKRFLMWAAAPVLLMVLIPASPFFAWRPYPTTPLAANNIAHVMPYVDAMMLITLVAAWLVIAAASTCIPGTTNTADELYAAKRRSQAVLFAGAAVLIAGVIEIDALLQWAASAGRIDSETAKTLSAAATVPVGAFFSLYLACAYLPAALVLRHRGALLAQAKNPGKTLAEQTEWMEEQGLLTSVGAQLTTVIALLGPVLASAPLKAIAGIG